VIAVYGLMMQAGTLDKYLKEMIILLFLKIPVILLIIQYKK
jgi:succinate-acetate transporter protein